MLNRIIFALISIANLVLAGVISTFLVEIHSYLTGVELGTAFAIIFTHVVVAGVGLYLTISKEPL